MTLLRQLSVLLLLIFTQQVSAQFSIGIKGGYTNAWEDYGEVETPEDAEIDVNGFNMSVLTYLDISKYFKIGIEPGYIKRGAACIPGWEPFFIGDTKFFLNYVELPLMFSGKLPLYIDKLEVFGKLGYGVSYMASAFRETMLQDGSFITDKLEIKETDSILNRWDHGVYTGVGIAFNIKKYTLFIDSEFYIGLTDAEKLNFSKNRSINYNIGITRNL